MGSRRIAKAQAQRVFRSPRDVAIFLRQMRQESGFRDVTSPAGAQGPAQIMPATARGWGVRNVHDPVEAYGAAARHMATYLRQYGGDWAKALTAYNAGPGAVGHSLPAETRNYISTILGGGSAKAGSLSLASGASGSRSPGVPSGAAGPLATGDPTKLALANLLGKSNPNSFLVRTLRAQGGADSPTAPSMSSQMLASLPSIRAAAARKGNPASVLQGGSASTSASGTAMFEGTRVAAWIAPALRYARQHGWKGHVNSGYRSYAEQAAIYASGVRPAARPGTSNHEGTQYPRGAVDVSDAAQLSAILLRSPWRKKLIYAGSKDPVHFSKPHGGSY